MFSHDQVWTAIDVLAQQNDISVSRLARNAGLDPTTFNKSKRFTGDGRPRWPSTESLSKVMSVTETKMDDLIALVRSHRQDQPDNLSLMHKLELGSSNRQNCVPLIGLAQAGSGGFFDDAGLPSGNGWDDVEFPPQNTEHTYALEISGDSMLPLYRHGDRIIVSPESSIRRGDRVVVRTNEGEVMAKVLAKKTSSSLELESINPLHENRVLHLRDIDWIARIVWASQ